MKKISLLVFIVFTALTFAAKRDDSEAASVKGTTAESQFIVTPIGFIKKQKKRTLIQLNARYQDGALGLEKWSHIWVFYWFDRNDTPALRAKLRVHPRGDRKNPATGVFATRAPVRPNLVALSLCRLLSVQGPVLEIEGIDAFDQTPVIDIKPYSRGLDTPKGNLKTPDWAGPQ
jgi:tRNA-Thr(GGU) m(6)t(6)A37 methyltransferase TsaA